MKFISLDLETTGLDPVENQIIEIGCVFVDTQKKIYKEFHKYVRNPKYIGSEYALALNARIFEVLKENKDQDIIHISNLGLALSVWFKECEYGYDEEIYIAGKNVEAFDLKFIRNQIQGLSNPFKRRTLDPAVLYLNILEDNDIPNLQECKNRAGFKDIEVSHNALEDAWDVVNLLLQNKITLEPHYIDKFEKDLKELDHLLHKETSYGPPEGYMFGDSKTFEVTSLNFEDILLELSSNKFVLEHFRKEDGMLYIKELIKIKNKK